MNELIISQLLEIISNSKLFSQLLEQTVISDDSFFASINTGEEDAKKIKLPLLRGYSGNWNASTNTPALANGAGLSATVYRVSVAGTRDLGNGAVTYGLEEIIYYNGSKWVKLIQSQISDIQGLQAALNNYLQNTTDTFTGVLTIDGNLDINENTKLRFYAPNTSGNPGSGFPQLEGKMYGVENQGVRLDTALEVASIKTTGGSLTQVVRGDGSLSVGYKVYTALLSQTSTNAPVATVLENTQGGTVVWSRANTGEYRATLSGVFAVNKTVTFVNQGATSPLADIRFNRQDLNGCTLRTFAHSTSTPLEGGYLNNVVTMLEIRVYN